LKNVILQQSIKTSAINYIGVLLGAIFTIYLAPKILTSTYNGMYRLLMEYAAVLAAYFHFGMPSIVNRFYHRVFDGNRSIDGFNFVVLICPGLLIFVFAFFLFIFRNSIVTFIANGSDYDLVYKYIPFIIPIICMYAYLYIIEAYSAMLGNIFTVNFCRNVLVKLFNILSLIVYAFTENFSLTMSVISLGCCVGIFISLNKLISNPVFKRNFKISSSFLKQNGLKKDFFNYLGYILISNITLFLVSKIDIFFVGKYTSLSSLAYYTTALFFVTLILVPYQAILNISFPVISKLFFNNKREALSAHIRNYSLFGFIIALYVFLMIWCNIDFIYEFIPNGSEYSIAKYVFLILGIGKLFDISIGSTGQLIAVSKYYYLILLSSIFTSVLSVLLGYLLTNKMDMNGAALAVSICSVCSAFFQVCIVEYFLKIHVFDKRFLLVLLLVPLILSISSLISFSSISLLYGFLINLVVITIIFFGVIIFFNISNEITDIFKRINFLMKWNR
jgi:O-antigen/teichoic acid export membrane protein